MLGLISTRFLASKATRAVSAAPSTPEVPVLGMKITPYAMFIKQNFTKGDGKNTEILKELSEKWKKMANEEKQKYDELSRKHNEKKIADFLKLSTEEQRTKIAEAREKKDERASRKQLKEKREKRKLEGRPTPPPNAYALFIKEKIVGSGHNARDKMKEAVAEWKALSESAKEKFNKEAKKLNDQYHADVAKWEAEKKEKDSH